VGETPSKKDPPLKSNDNPAFVTVQLCEAYREALRTEIKSIRNQIIGAIGITTAIITILQLILNFL